MNGTEFNQIFFDFLHNCPTPFHTVDYLANIFEKAGFTRLQENKTWDIQAGNNYYCIRDNSSFLGIKLAADSKNNSAWRMTGAHTDSPSLQIKPTPLKDSQAAFQLGVEVYGGPLLTTWFDRDLGLAGRVTLAGDDDQIIIRTIDFQKPMAIIPSLAIHLDREANKNHTVERQKHLYPLLCLATEDTKKLCFHDILQQQIKNQYPDLSVNDILGFDLFCYDTHAPALVGLNEDFIAASRLDNLVSCFVGAKALLQNQTSDNCLLLCSNHEEIGSSSVAGAQGNFLSSALERFLPNSSTRGRVFQNSMFLSLDNAHAVHPNFPEKHDQQHLPLLNHGPVIKYNSNQRYATTSRSAALYKTLAREVDVPIQEFAMNNDLTCGSTIGPMVATMLGIQTIDIGIPSLAMHSIRETIGTKDLYMLYQTISHFYSRPTLPQSEM